MPKTTYDFAMHPVAAIKVGKRQRSNMEEGESLAESIVEKGLLQPIVITRKGILVAGGRRLHAVVKLGWEKIPVHYIEDMSPAERKLLELEENIKRQNLPWKDECNAVLEYHQLRLKKTPKWTAAGTAIAIGISPEWVSKRIAVAEALAGGDEHIQDAQGANAAYNTLTRKQSREFDAAMDNLDDELSGVKPPTKEEKAGPTVSSRTKTDDVTMLVENVSFLDWAPKYSGPKFNLIHCDFPYGIGHGKSDQGGAAGWDSYEDDPGIYRDLLRCLIQHIEVLAQASCHLMFWFSMKHYEWTRQRLEEAFKVNPYPLIWYKEDGKGILPDPNRGPRQLYETAFLASRGDRKIIQATNNVVPFPVGQKKHLSEKPQPMVEMFFRMLVSEDTRILDPTCGSGTALAAARWRKAKLIHGLDTDPDAVEQAKRLLRNTPQGGFSAEPDDLKEESDETANNT